MAASPVQGDCKRGHLATPESSLTWCLAHLFKPGKAEGDKRSKVSQWRALVAIRTQHIKGDKAGIARFRTKGGLRPLLDLLKQPECSRKTLDLALSILANCCTELETRIEVRKLGGIRIIVEILKQNVALETVQNRAARALGNLAMDPESSALIHSAGGVPLLLFCVSHSSAPSSPTAAPPTEPCPKLECAQSAARALLYLSDTHSNRLALLTWGTLTALAPLIAPEYPQSLRRAALRTLHELTRSCGAECAREVSRSGVLAQLGVMASGEAGKPFEELALKTLANMCVQGSLRPLVGSLGVIQKFADEVKREPLKCGVFLKALCLCCREAVNRAKVKESGGLEALMGVLSAHPGHTQCLCHLIIMALVDFLFDEAAMEQLLELGLVPVLIARLVELTRGEERSTEKTVSSPSSASCTEFLPSSCFDSFDFPPPPEGCRREEKDAGLFSSSFLSLRSWLVSEGLIFSEGDLLDSSGVEGDWGSLQIPSSFSPQTSSPNSLSSHKSCSPSNPAAPSSSKRSSKPTDPPPSSPQPNQPGSSSMTPPTPQTPVSPSNFSSPQKRRQRANSAAACLAKVTLDAPPSAPRPPTAYHPGLWTLDPAILLLLSWFSHTDDPSAVLISSGVMSGLLYYLTQHQDPSTRCFRILCRLSCNPNCLQALVRTGSVALIQHLLCQRGGGWEGEERQTDRVKAKVKQLGFTLLSNLRVQCESGFGAGVLAHVMLSGSETDKMNCALSLPLICSNKSLLKKLLVDSGGLLLALGPLADEDDVDDNNHSECEKLLSDWLPHPGLTSGLHSLFSSLLIGCLSTLTSGIKLQLDKKHPITTRPVGDKTSPPPLKRARLADICPYGASGFDLVLLLDDGTRVQASREAVAGAEGGDGTDAGGSEYFWALLRGGFGEARGNVDDAIWIKDVSTGMLLPVLHHLHGCRLSRDAHEGDETGRCQVLDKLVHGGLGIEEDFQKTALGEAMVGACRFLVTELQRQLEDACVSLLLSCSTTIRAGPSEKPASKIDQECVESAEENLATRTSELELSGVELQVENTLGQTKKPNLSKTDRNKTSSGLKTTSKTIKSTRSSCAAAADKSLDPEESKSRPKNLKSPAKRLKAQDSSSVPGSGGGSLALLLPQVYWFSQRYNYPALGRACLSMLLGCQDCPRPFSSSALAGECLHKLSRESDCTETLKQDLLSLATEALS